MGKESISMVIKGKRIDGKKPQICIPIVSSTEKTLLREAEEITALKPDIIEWRVDYFENVERVEKVILTLQKLKKLIGDYPIIFTCRSIEEGGYRDISISKRIELIKKVIDTGQVDIVDLELMNEKKKIQEILTYAHQKNIKIILSNHDFNNTPNKEIIIERLVKAQEYGADIGKIAVMPKNQRDVLTLLEATLEAKEKYLKIPLITMAMGEKGKITRIAGGLFGSFITFAVGKRESAPGQIPIVKLRNAIDVIYNFENP